MCVCLPLRHHFQGSCYLPSASWTLEQRGCKTTGTHTQIHIKMCMREGIHTHSLLHFSALYLSQQSTSVSLVIPQSLFVSQTNTQMQPPSLSLSLSLPLSVWAAAAWADLPMLTGLSHLPAGCCSSPARQSGCLLCGHSWRMWRT